MAFVRWVVGISVFLALLFLSLQNAELVTIRFYHWFSWEAPLIFLLLIAFALGVVAGLLAGLMRYVRVKRELGRVHREHRRVADARQDLPLDDG
jgi:lipopolysaccharide assembly protein A